MSDWTEQEEKEFLMSLVAALDFLRKMSYSSTIYNLAYELQYRSIVKEAELMGFVDPLERLGYYDEPTPLIDLGYRDKPCEQ